MKCWLRAANEQPAGNIYAEWVKAQNESYRVAETNRLIAQVPPPDSASSPPAETLKLAKWLLASDVVVRATGIPRGSRRDKGPSSSSRPSRPGIDAVSGGLGNRTPAPCSALGAPDSTLETSPVHLGAAPQPAESPPTWVLETSLHVIERVPAEGRGKAAQFIPIRFIFFNKLTKNDKLLMAYSALVLGQEVGRDIAVGKLIHGDDHVTQKVKISALAGEVSKRLEKLAALLSSSTPHDLVLNRHCGECGFHDRCRKIAVEKDDLSLLATMSTKERQKLRSKGVFTVTQLSYTFRPRRRPKRLRDKREKYHHALKALAIREKKTHIVGAPEFKIDGTPVYLDVEGLPDRDFYYLIGVRIGNGESAVQHSLWADTIEHEAKIWREFLALLEAVENPVLIHYGSYETTFLERMGERFGKSPAGSAAKAIQAAVNLLSVTFAQVYFPTFSNGLKEVAGNLGFRWSDPTATGIRTVVWRQEWEASRAHVVKQALFTYNAEDCTALEVVAHKLLDLRGGSPQAGIPFHGEAVDTTQMKWEHPYGFKQNTFVFPELNAINDAAYWDYQRERVYVKSNVSVKRALTTPRRPKNILPPNKTIECSRPRRCPKCASKTFYKHTKYTKTVFDLKFMRHGLKRWITRYRFHRYRCLGCRTVFQPQETCWGKGKYGSEIRAYSLYLSIDLRMPQLHVASKLNRLFGFHLSSADIGNFKADAAENYRAACDNLVSRLCSGRLLHVDETQGNARDKGGFVWVFANMQEVAYIYSVTREGDLLQTLLKGFDGVLVSDFYAAYDAIPCHQQKCLIHLIRDLNDDVLKHPYDEEMKQVALAFALLLKPMVESVDRYGLKTRFLKKHLASVRRFYRRISETNLQSETAVKFKERLEKNRDKLFTFLSFDGVPWNNNNAEHAVKPFAALRQIIGGITTEKGLRDYLVLLSLCETCKYMGVDFLNFLRSGEKDIYAFAESRRGRRRRSPADHPQVPLVNASANQ